MRPGLSAQALPLAHEDDLCGAPALAAFRRHTVPGPVGVELPGLRVVAEQRLEDPLELVPDLHVLDRDDDLDPMLEVAGHEVGASEQVRPLLVDLEAVDPAVLEEAA